MSIRSPVRAPSFRFRVTLASEIAVAFVNRPRGPARFQRNKSGRSAQAVQQSKERHGKCSRDQRTQPKTERKERSRMIQQPPLCDRQNLLVKMKKEKAQREAA